MTNKPSVRRRKVIRRRAYPNPHRAGFKRWVLTLECGHRVLKTATEGGASIKSTDCYRCVPVEDPAP